VSFQTSPPTPVERVSPSLFKRIYDEYGYREAIAQDPSSLSYVAEPAPGIWLFAIDSAEYGNNEALGHPVTAGRIRIVKVDLPARRFVIDTRHVTAIPSHPADFVPHASDFLVTGLSGITMGQLTGPPFSLDPAVAAQVAPLVVVAWSPTTPATRLRRRPSNPRSRA